MTSETSVEAAGELDSGSAPLSAAKVGGLWGLLLAAVGGGLAAVAHPPFGVWPGVFGFAVIVIALDAAPTRRRWRAAFARGWAAGVGYFLIGTWWVAEAFFVDPKVHGWQAPFAVLFMAGGIALFWGAAGLAYRTISPRGATRVLGFAAVFSLLEWLRGHLFTGFPWDLPGEAWRAGSAMSQPASVIGAYGLTFMTLAMGASPALLLPCEAGEMSAKPTEGAARRGRARAAPLTRLRLVLSARFAGGEKKGRSASTQRGMRGDCALALGLAAATLATLWSYGALRLAAAHEPDTALRLRLVQPNLGELAAWSEPAFRARFTRFVQLTAAPSPRPPDVVIWPEGAIPAAFDDFLAPGTWTETALRSALRPGEFLLSGGYRVGGSPAHRLYFNTLAALQRTGSGLRTLALYDKYRLVPFGEYLPLEGLLTPLGVASLMQAGESFTPGPPPQPITIAGLPRVQPLICYESLYPGFTSARGGRPAWIVNVSDDAWFGHTSGPLQHLNLASYRAIEEGLPLIRSTPTGVSAVVDAYGRTKASLTLGQAGVLDADLPQALAPTLYSRWRELPFWGLLVSALGVSLLAKARQARTRSALRAGGGSAIIGHAS